MSAQYPPPPVYPPYGNQVPQQQPPAARQDPGQIFGILSIVFAILFSILGLIFGIVGRQKSKKAGLKPNTAATVGLWLSVAFMVAGAVIGVVASVSAGNAIKEMESQAASTEPLSGGPSRAASDASFHDGVFTTPDYTIKITDTKVIKPGAKGNEYGHEPVLAFWYDVTNTSDPSLDPSTAWVMTFQVVQDNDPNAVNELNRAMSPDENYRDSQSEKIKIGGTVSNAVSFELTDTTTPVTLIASEDFGAGGPIGQQTFAVN